MYGTIARMQLKPGARERFRQVSELNEAGHIPGHMATYVYQSDESESVVWLAVVFRDRESYVRNADSPEQDERYREMRELLTADPEWHDGEVIWSMAGEQPVPGSAEGSPSI